MIIVKKENLFVFHLRLSVLYSNYFFIEDISQVVLSHLADRPAKALAAQEKKT